MNSWKPMSEAKRDGTPYLVKLKPNYKLNHQLLGFSDGLIAVMQNMTDTYETGIRWDSGWQFAAPVGFGGFRDEQLVGFQELPE